MEQQTLYLSVALEVIDKDELDALRDKAEVCAKQDRDAWTKSAFEQLYAKLELHRAALEAVEVLEDMYEQRDAEVERWFAKWCDTYAQLDTYKTLWKDAERDIQTLDPSYDAEHIIAILS